MGAKKKFLKNLTTYTANKLTDDANAKLYGTKFSFISLYLTKHFVTENFDESVG